MPQKYSHHYSALIKLGCPIVVGQLGMIIQGIADSVMVGQYSADSLSAAGFVNGIFNLAIVFGMGFSYGLTPLVGRMYGTGHRQGAVNALLNSLIANTFIAIIAAILLIVLYANLENIGQPDNLLPLIKPYFILMLISIPFMQIFWGYKQFFDGITDTSTSMWIMLTGNALNILLNYILIFGHWGAPEWGLWGAGLATLLSRVFMCVSIYVIFHFGKRYKAFSTEFKRVAANMATFKELNKLGWPIALQMGMETASFSLSAIMMGWIGAVALASHQILCTIGTICFMVYYGIGAAVTIRESHYMGQNDLPNVRRSAYAGFHLILVFGSIASLNIFLFRDSLGGWFTDDVNVGIMTASMVIPMLAYQFGDGLQCCFANALRGIEDVKPMVLYSFIAYIVISLPLSYIFAFPVGLGAIGIWLGFPFGLTSAGIMFLKRFNKRTKTL